MDASPMNKLPGELRNRIYELVADSPQGLHFRKHNKDESFSWCENDVSARKPDLADVMALSRTCKQIRQEALSIFYSINTFIFYPRFWTFGFKMTRAQTRSYCTDLGVLRQWLKGIGRVNASCIKTLVLDLGAWDKDKTHRVDRPGTIIHNTFNRSDPNNRDWWQATRKLERKIIHPHLEPDCISIHVQLNRMPRNREVRAFYDSLWRLAPSDRPRKRPSWFKDYTTFLISATDGIKAADQIQRVYTRQEDQFEKYLKQPFRGFFDEILPTFKAHAELNRDIMLRAIGEKTKDQQNDVANSIAALKVD